MEHKVRGELTEARVAFDELLASFPDYIAAYLHAAAVVATLGERDTSISLLERGIAAATKTGDAHARKELESALAAA